MGGDVPQGNPLLLSGAVSIVRSIDLSATISDGEYEPPLRVLLIASNPFGDLKLDRELNGIRERLEHGAFSWTC